MGMDDDIGGGGMPGGFSGFSSFGGGGIPGRRAGGRSSSSRFDGMNGGPRAPTPEVTVLEKPLPVSLEELYKGTTKKMKIKRKKFDANTGKQIVEDRILEVPIKPGLKAGSKIKFKDVGDQVEGGTQDLHFVVEEVSSPTFMSKTEKSAEKPNRRSRNHIPHSPVTATTSKPLSRSTSKKH
jgi:DnaJ family protein B protein 4